MKNKRFNLLLIAVVTLVALWSLWPTWSDYLPFEAARQFCLIAGQS